ncbi:MAG: amidotransferase [Candidatus Lindowbacteria bacterium RIFCSPLOWO2_12_FULL_62_27]|nr:MAG: amidotransferase [Candidatus Lindowbacteria bacterium RIFCSPLOWO2_02_FULL_62_12]OGH62884.1 MAG: amidotransferase [Candidatus Lindowbacteria bacterium RIFCSPLOWO2_12_FULL_62_27]
MNIHVLQHAPFEGIGSIESWLSERGAAVGYTRFYESPALPDVADLDLILVMGGPMSVNDESTLPWLRDEKRFVSGAIRAGKAVLGICLGAQLIAAALGSRVYPGRCKEIGWFDIHGTSDQPGLFRFPETATVFHWHGETFDLPDGAARLARSDGCDNQAFQIGSNVIGLQFHLETTPQSLDALISHCQSELVDDDFIQTESAMRKAPAESYARIHDIMTEVLNYVTRQ